MLKKCDIKRMLAKNETEAKEIEDEL